MICLRCEKEEFYAAQRFVEQEYKQKSLHVETPVMVCAHCGWFTVSLPQVDLLLARTKEVYNFELWWEKNYPHMQVSPGAGSLATNVVGMIKVIAKQAWMAAQEERPCAICRGTGTHDKMVGDKVWSEPCPDCSP